MLGTVDVERITAVATLLLKSVLGTVDVERITAVATLLLKSVLGTVDVERITAVATIGVGRWLGAKLNQKSRGWGGGGGASYTSGNIGQVLITIFLFCL